MELLQYWKVIQKNWRWIGLIMAAVLVITTIFTINQPYVYESNATLLLTSPVRDNNPYLQNQMASSLADTYSARMQTRAFAEEVVKELPSTSVGQALGSITTRLRPNTFFFTIGARGNSPEQAQQLVGAVVKVFLRTTAALQAEAGEGQSTIRNDIRKRLEGALEDIRGQITIYRERIATLESQPVTREREDQVLQLRGQLVTLQQTEAQTLTSLVQIDDPTPPPSAVVIDPPLPGRQLERRLTANLLLATVVALVLGIGFAFLRNYIDNTVQSAEHLEEIQGLTPMAVIGTVGTSGKRTYGYGRFVKGRSEANEAKDGRLVGSNLVTIDNPRSPESECFRVLRTNIQFSSIEKPLHTLVVTSAQPGEGKSFTASNLAVVIAQAGKRVILVDTDLRKPTQHKVFNLSNSAGFSNLISDKSTDIADVIQNIPGQSSLAVITSGPLPPNPSEMLNSQHAIEVMNQLKQQADVVIYDAPPVGAVTDPVILATRTDGVVLVIGAGSTRRDVVTRAVKSLQKVGVQTLLPVLNRVKTKDMQGYYYYQYYGSDSPKQELPLDGAGEHTNGKAPLNGNAHVNGVSPESHESIKPVGRGRG